MNGRSLQATSGEQQNSVFYQELNNESPMEHSKTQDGRIFQTENSDQTRPRTPDTDEHKIWSPESYQSKGHIQNEGEPGSTISGSNFQNTFYEKKSQVSHDIGAQELELHQPGPFYPVQQNLQEQLESGEVQSQEHESPGDPRSHSFGKQLQIQLQRTEMIPQIALQTHYIDHHTELPERGGGIISSISTVYQPPGLQVHPQKQEEGGGVVSNQRHGQPQRLGQFPQMQSVVAMPIVQQAFLDSDQNSQIQQQGNKLMPNPQQGVNGLVQQQSFGQEQQSQSGIESQQQQLQVLPVKGNPNGALPQCGVDLPEERPVTPAWTASYPGSGAKLTWKLVRGITGLWTSDDHDHNGRVESGVVVAVKTHFPSHTPGEVFFKPSLRHIQRAVLILRNPFAAIPSYHNFVYEQMNNLRNHSTRAPVDVWLKWRDAFFEIELKAWVDHAQYWIDNYLGSFFLLPFEHLTSDVTGISTLTSLTAFFAAADDQIGKHIAAEEQLPCIWEMYVKGKDLDNVETKKRHSHREGGPTEYPYTNLQLESMIASIVQFQNANPSVDGLSDLLNEYIVVIENKRVQQDGVFNSV